MTCETCKGELWVCSEHPEQPWPHGECAEGVPCACNPQAAMPPGSRVLWDAERGWLQ